MHIYSKYAIGLCFLLMFLSGVFYYPKWKQQDTEATISWDVSGYYMYLPAIFIYKDISNAGYRQYVIDNYKPSPQFDQAFLHSSGNYVMKYSSGQAIIFSPFFFTAHIITQNFTSYKADGFSYPYQLAIGIGALFYALIGLIFLRKVLINYFPDKVTAIALICLVLASNYLNYAAIDGAMTHNTLFTLYTLLVYSTIKFYRHPSLWKGALIGALIGLATITRPTEFISFLIPVFWGVSSKEQVKNRFQFLSNHIPYISISIVFMLLFIFLQLAYWKYVTGQWIVYSYQNEGFSFLQPHIWQCLFSYRSGWLMYSPVMLLSIIGFIFLYKSYRQIFWSVFIFCLLFTYLCFSWDVWWYGGSLGQRAMVQSYPLLAFPMAALINFLLSSRIVYKIILIAFLAFCTWYNLWLTHQAHKGGLLVAGEMTGEYFRAIFGKNKVDNRVRSLLDNKYMFEAEPEETIVVYENDFETDSSQNQTTKNAILGNSIYLDKEKQFSIEYEFSLPPSSNKKIRASADFKAIEKEWDTWKMAQFVIKFYDGDKQVQSNHVRVFRLLNAGETRNILLDAKIPTKKFNRVAVLFWNSGSDKTILIDNLKVIIFN